MNRADHGEGTMKLLFIIAGILAGWFADDLILWIKSKRNFKGSPNNKEAEAGSKSTKDL